MSDIYITQPDVEPVTPPVESADYSAIRWQNQQDWQRQQLTQEFFQKLSAQAGECENRARHLACNYHQTNNHQEIIQLLVRAVELRNIIQTYGTASTVHW